ncbi:hypothetical protein Peur_051123 [Populus x canadensis]
MVGTCKTKAFIKDLCVWHTSAERQFTRESARSQKSDWPRAVQCPTIVTRMLGLPTGINRHVLQLTLLLLMSP